MIMGTTIVLTSSTMTQTMIMDTITAMSSNFGSTATALPSVTAGPLKDTTQLIIIGSSAAGGVVFVILILLVVCLIVGVWGWRVQKQRKKK